MGCGSSCMDGCISCLWCLRGFKQTCCCGDNTENSQKVDVETFFQKILPTLKTGDLLLTGWPNCSQNTRLRKLMLNSRFTHVGIVYNPLDAGAQGILTATDKLNPNQQPTVMMYHATAYDVKPPIESNERFAGMDLEPANKFLSRYLLHVPYCEEKHPPGVECKETPIVGCRRLNIERNEEFYRKIQKVYEATANRPYEKSIYNIGVSSGYVGCLKNEADPKELFCSELVAVIYKELGVLPADLNESMLCPGHFTTRRSNELPLTKATLDGEIYVAGPITPQQVQQIQQQK